MPNISIYHSATTTPNATTLAPCDPDIYCAPNFYLDQTTCECVCDIQSVYCDGKFNNLDESICECFCEADYYCTGTYQYADPVVCDCGCTLLPSNCASGQVIDYDRCLCVTKTTTSRF